jgi:hypothetical protein
MQIIRHDSGRVQLLQQAAYYFRPPSSFLSPSALLSSFLSLLSSLLSLFYVSSYYTRKWLRWREPAATVNDRSILSSERNRKCSVEKILIVGLKGLVAQKNWLTVNRQS